MVEKTGDKANTPFIFQTGIWDEAVVTDVQNRFIIPLRKMLVVARAHSKQELEKKMEEGRIGKRDGGHGGAAEQKGPEMSVEVMGATLPKMSYEDELKVYFS